jgi:beta-glucanase (GH16 family)
MQSFNDSQEIDMEFLSSQFSVENNTFPVNLVRQSPQSASQGFSTSGPDNYIVKNLPFNPTTAFHEYRIDFLPGKVVFYADGHVLHVMHTSSSASQPGHLILTHWSNGNELWSGGPPTQDAAITVSYVKSYFNSSLSDRSQAFSSRCKDPHVPNAICAIPEQMVPPDPTGPNGNATANTYFFSNYQNSTVGQIVYHESQGRRAHVTWQTFCVTALFLMYHGVSTRVW